MLRVMERPPSYLLLENVAGFSSSASRARLLEVLRERLYVVQEFALSPLQLGMPNQRLRYFLLAKRAPLSFAAVAAVTQGTGLCRELPNPMPRRACRVREFLCEPSDTLYLYRLPPALRTPLARVPRVPASLMRFA